jgi:probable phosphoglycerate mutase
VTVYLARHGETVWNAEGRYQGRLDSPLTDTGRAQAEATALTMRERGIERLLCSPLGRARDTARAVETALGLGAEIDADLAESDIGRWEGLTRDEVEAAFPGELARREANRLQYRPPGGESLVDMLVRARAVAGRLDGRTTLIVAHSAINRVLVAALIGWEHRIADIYQPHHVIYRIDRATGTTEVTHLVDGVSHPGPYTAGWS